MLDKRLIILLTYVICSTLSSEDEDKTNCTCDPKADEEEVCSNEMKTYPGECEMKCASPDATVTFYSSCENAIRFMLGSDYGLEDATTPSNSKLASTTDIYSSNPNMKSAEPDLTTSLPDVTSTEESLDLPTSTPQSSTETQSDVLSNLTTITETQLDVLTTEPSPSSTATSSASDSTVCNAEFRTDTGECLHVTTDSTLQSDYSTILPDQERPVIPEPLAIQAPLYDSHLTYRRNMPSLTPSSNSFLPPSQNLLPSIPRPSSINQPFPPISNAPADAYYPFYHPLPPPPISAPFYPAPPPSPNSASFNRAPPPMDPNFFYPAAPSPPVSSPAYPNYAPQRFPILSFSHNPRPMRSNPSVRNKRSFTRRTMRYTTPFRRFEQSYFGSSQTSNLNRTLSGISLNNPDNSNFTFPPFHSVSTPLTFRRSFSYKSFPTAPVMKPIEVSRSSTYNDNTGTSRSAVVSRSSTYDEATGTRRSAEVTHSVGTGPNTFVIRRSYSSKSVPTATDTKPILLLSSTYNQRTGSYGSAEEDKVSDTTMEKQTKLLNEALKEIVKFNINNVTSTQAHNLQVKI